MTPAEILEAAANAIDMRGWCQGNLEVNGRVCIAGALAVACTGESAGGFEVVPDVVSRALGKATGADGLLGCWNDQPERTAEEVTSTMRAVAATLRAQEQISESVMV